MFASLNLVIRHQDEWIIEHDLHLFHIGNHVMREVATFESHAFDDLQCRLNRVAKFHRDDPVIASPLKGVCDHVSKLCVVGGNARNRTQPGGALQGLGRALQRRDGPRDRQFEAFDQFHRVGPFCEALQTVLDKYIGQDRGSGRAVTRHFVGLL